ncbi:hypothetical protein F4553_003255 [Allocatelliglobosispora scoriae]|uniref:Esterase-like activity of phytase family protein n=1 Tax=Allocatelliglobosispora scoriae TaxID=643052 RepID=A0A841BR81_9ACTN|nr:hypothetical protein [Allocatelliglobosispora scoriae]MBB5869876.1 hypothetical protein [Allocatelliglobosispora scoriae]
MWGLVRFVAVVSAFVLAGAPAGAAEGDEVPVAVCTVKDSRVSELSGLVATATGYVAINDSNWDPSDIKIFFLDRACKVTRTVGYPTSARDPEDLAMAADGTLWIADVGDNFNAATRRTTIALWRLAPGGRTPVIYRFTYPDGPHDAEALLLERDGSPIIVTKELGGPASLYAPAEKPRAKTAQGVPLHKIGEVRLPSTLTPNPFDSIGRRTVTGAAQTADGSRVALRTYADAFEWDVTTDVLTAITTGKPRITALPNEAQGESIAYPVDGDGFLTVSDQPAGGTVIARYGVPPRPSPSRTGDGPAASGEVVAVRAANRSGLAGMGIAAAGLLIIGLAVALLRRRKRG